MEIVDQTIRCSQCYTLYNAVNKKHINSRSSYRRKRWTRSGCRKYEDCWTVDIILKNLNSHLYGCNEDHLVFSSGQKFWYLLCCSKISSAIAVILGIFWRMNATGWIPGGLIPPELKWSVGCKLQSYLIGYSCRYLTRIVFVCASNVVLFSLMVWSVFMPWYAVYIQSRRLIDDVGIK